MVVLLEAERNTLKSMSRYWAEVSRRDDQSPLVHELRHVNAMLGTKILFIIADYIELLEEIKKLGTDICPICGEEKPITDLHRNCGK